MKLQSYIFSLSVHTRGYPSPRFFSRSLVPGPFRGRTPVSGSFPCHWSQVFYGGDGVAPGQGAGGRYASCVHAGGLSCLKCSFVIELSYLKFCLKIPTALQKLFRVNQFNIRIGRGFISGIQYYINPTS